MHKIMLSGVAAAVLLTVGARQASAAEYGAFVIRNPTRETIHYQVKWGKGEWKSFSLSPGERRAHYYDLDADNWGPIPYVRFDWILNDGDVTFKTYEIDGSAVDNPWRGKKYVFRISGRFLDLYND